MESLLFCVFDSTIVNLPTYRQFANAAWDWIIQNKQTNKKVEAEKKMKVASSLGNPSSYFYNKRYNMLL